MRSQRPQTDVLLLVDDEPDYLTAFIGRHESYLAREGLEIRGVGSAREARRFLSRERAQVRLALVDILLPRPQVATRLLEWIAANCSQVVRVGITAHAEREVIGEMLNERLLQGHLEKGWSARKQRRLISMLLERSPDPAAHSQITRAIGRWLEMNPEMRRSRIGFLDRPPMTMGQMLSEIQNGTPFGKRQERLIYQIAFDQWAGKHVETGPGSARR